MTTIYLTENCDLYDKAKTLSLRHICHPIEILKTENGKPYFEGNELYLSISHKQNLGVITLSTLPVGVDVELFSGKEHNPIISRFEEKERGEIQSERDFLIHWTVREAFVKLQGNRLADLFRHLSCFGGNIYLDGNKQTCNVSFYDIDNGIICLCGGDSQVTVEKLI
jgi:phosphopantetheinyl transferase